MGGMSAFSTQFIGLTISFVQLGIAAAQGLYYHRVFPHDKRLLKILNTAGTLLSTFMYWSFVSGCFRSKSPRTSTIQFELDLWQAMILLFVSVPRRSLLRVTLTSLHRSFYCHRVWISKSSCVSCASLVIQLFVIPPQQAGAFANDTILKISAAAAIQSISCDFTISFSVYFYLRPGRTGVRRMDARIQSIAHNFISMGFLVCLLAISICILYWADAPAAIGGVAMVLRSCETTTQPSTLTRDTITRLNARKPPGRLQTMEIELPTT
ncbi:hypothetical protein EDD22DRAFT_892011 [Suillus occidentalis]|nr:hypothetical protein EDD22DRAFT_892011 [Suillus occidentalis]